ncbi:MAG: biotin--[acetyl-CoA-carboxylase] ligase [Phycisphaeraceae bacterium]|nr:biotin--[acetyl-CoA-carboxylase] ligase [Phycisphaeraceae bacterium]
MLAADYSLVDSTNDRVRRWSRLNPGTPLLVSSVAQTAGRGRSGRVWQSPPGGVWMSLAWPLTAPTARYQPAPLLAGLAVVESLEELLPLDPAALRIKWPNDVLLSGRKVAGILCEMTSSDVKSTLSGPELLIIGIGVNANFTPEALGDDLRFPAGTLYHALGRPVARAELIRQIRRRLADHLTDLQTEGFTAQTRWKIESRLAFRDQPVALRRGDGPLEGLCRGIDEQGRLQLEIAGKTTAHASGEVEQLRPLESLLHPSHHGPPADIHP